MKKRLLIILLLFPLFLLLQSCSDLSDLKFPEIYECGDFSYSVMKVDGEMMAGIRGASEEGFKKEVLVIPEYLDGYKVYGMYDKGPSSWRPRFPNAKKIFINYEISFKVSTVCVDKIFVNGEALNKQTIGNIWDSKEYYPASIDFNNYEVGDEKSIFHANLSYYTNYGDNTIYWIDDYDNELVSYIPEDPTREGYIFDGWYKESECINKWDFENDIIPAKEYINKGYPTEEYIYKENQLFAKWISANEDV